MSRASSDLYLVIPVFNELANLDRLFQSLNAVQEEFGSRYGVHVVLVDDGSTDGTPARARELGQGLDLVVLAKQVNQGPGAAFGSGFAYLAGRLADGDWVVTLEGDNTSRRELVRRMLTRAEEGYDVVLASPYLYGGGIASTSAHRVFLSHVANAFVKEFLGIHGIMTVSSFFRLYRGSTIARLQALYGPGIVETCGFECMVELLLKMILVGTTISEVPMVLDNSRRAGKSKMRIWRTIAGYFRLWPLLAGWKRAAELSSARWQPAPVQTAPAPTNTPPPAG